MIRLFFFVLALLVFGDASPRTVYGYRTGDACRAGNPYGAGHRYYVSPAGDDAGSGNKQRPLRTLQRVNRLRLHPGDTVFLETGQVFAGTLRINAGEGGTKEHPLVITSYGREAAGTGTAGRGAATIRSGDSTAIVLDRASYISLQHLHLEGSGRKNGNTKDGLDVLNCHHITVDSVTVTGFQKSGVYVYESAYVRMLRVRATGNGYAGIGVEGPYGKREGHDILVKDCLADNNPGDPSNLSNHSGNGIIVGYCRNVTIEHCIAHDNGWDMPRVGNGPVGIWGYESDSLVIQHCISFRNRTAKGADDGGGYDLDGGMTHSVIRYCLSYENEGSGFGLFQYAGAANWHDNAVHDCVSNNDGLVSAAHAGVFIWNSSRDARQLRNCAFYNNIIYNTKGAAINYAREGEHSGFRFYDNVFIATDSLIKGQWDASDHFERNHWTGILPDSSFR